MNDFSDLEAELKQIRPRPASPNLESRIAAALAQSSTATAGILPKRSRFQLNWFSLGLGAAAAAVVLTFAWLNLARTPAAPRLSVASAHQPTLSPATAAPETSATNSFVPDGLTRVVYHRRDEGLVYPRTADAPVRRVRSRARETLQWKEPATGASLRVSYPTEEVELIPVAGQ